MSRSSTVRPPNIDFAVRELIQITKKKKCYDKFPDFNSSGGLCPPLWDTVTCWSPVPFGETASQPCPMFQERNIIGVATDLSLRAFRECLSSGQWKVKADYSICEDNLEELYVPKQRRDAVAYIIIVCSVLSMIALGISLFIFCYFKTLYCSRLRVHRNLCIALILYLVCLYPPALNVVEDLRLHDYDSLCKSLLVLHMFSGSACCAWMFLEGLLLHSRVTVSIFQKKAPFKLYYFIGWGLPTIMTIAWTIAHSQVSKRECWSDFNENPYLWLITAPELLALSMNTVFLINIIRVLLTKHQANNTTEVIQVKKAMKATALLFPLLGIPHLISCVASVTDSDVYWIFTAIFWSNQGLGFGILYCFLNADVQTALRNAYLRSVIRRNPNRSRFKASRGMSQTSNTYFSSNSDALQRDNSKYKMSSRVSIKVEESPEVSQPQKYKIVKSGKETLTNQESLTLM